MNRKYMAAMVTVAAVAAIAQLSSCGAKGGGYSPGGAHGVLPAGNVQSVSGFDASSVAISLTALGGLDAKNFNLAIEDSEGGEVVLKVTATGRAAIPYALFELHYDSAFYSPSSVGFSDYFGQEGVITAGITSVAGNLGIAVVPANYDHRPSVKRAGDIATVKLRREPFRGKSAAGYNAFAERERPVPVGYGNAPGEINFTGIRWSEVLVGDGDLNGQVNVEDVLQIAENYGSSTTEFPQLTYLDFDLSGSIGIPDITSIALNYLSTVGGYCVYYQSNSMFFDPELAVQDVVYYSETATEFDQFGFPVRSSSFASVPPEGELWHYFVVPFDAEFDVIAFSASSGFLVSGERPPGPPTMIVDFKVEISGDVGTKAVFSSETPNQLVEFRMGEVYTFDLLDVEGRLWNWVNAEYEEPVVITREHYFWNPDWEDSIVWQAIPTNAFEFSAATGSGVTGACTGVGEQGFFIMAELAGHQCSFEVSMAS